MGPCCTGKSSVAELIGDKSNIQIVTGKDYLRLSCDETEAWSLFLKQIKSVAASRAETLIYLLDDAGKVQDLMNIEGVNLVKFSASLEVIRHRYENRLQGKLPGVAVKMLDTQKKMWDRVNCPLSIDTSGERGVKDVAHEVLQRIT
jgi:cytidylate kinase